MAALSRGAVLLRAKARGGRPVRPFAALPLTLVPHRRLFLNSLVTASLPLAVVLD
jgi:hypothetical protein